jgi:hypothetical protein
MFKNKIIQNKFYKYSDTFIKIKKITKYNNTIVCIDIKTNEEINIPIVGSDILLKRIYTVGEVAKIVDREPNTLRKYEKKNLIVLSKKFNEECGNYKNWRYYEESDIYGMVEFFNTRKSGRPAASKTADSRIKEINQKVKLHL